MESVVAKAPATVAPMLTHPREIEGGNSGRVFFVYDRLVGAKEAAYRAFMDSSLNVTSCRIGEAVDSYTGQDVLVSVREPLDSSGIYMGDKLINELKSGNPALKVLVASDVREPESDGGAEAVNYYRQNVRGKVDAYYPYPLDPDLLVAKVRGWLDTDRNI